MSMDLHRLRVVEFDSLLSEKGDKKNILELGDTKQEDCKTLSSDGNDNETNQLESDKIFLRDHASPPESSKISSFIKYKSNSEIFNISPNEKLKQTHFNINTSLGDVKKSFQENMQCQKKRTLRLFNKRARNKPNIKEKKAVRKKNDEVNFLFTRDTPSFMRCPGKRAKNESTNDHDPKVMNDVFGFQENRSIDPRLYQTSCNYLNIDKFSIKNIKKGFYRKPKAKPAPVRNCFCKHHAMRILTSAVTGSGKKDERNASIYYNLNMHSCPRRPRLKRNNSLYEEVWAREQPLFLANDKNVEVSPSSLITVAKSYCNANVGPSQIELTSCLQCPPSGTNRDALPIHRKVPLPRRNKPYPQHSTPSPSSESNGPEQYQPQVVTCKRKRINVKKIFSIINNQRTKLFSGFFQRVNAFHIKNNTPGKRCIKYAFFGLLIVVWSPCLLAVILAWAVMCPVKLTNMLNNNKTKSLLPVLSSFANKFRKKNTRSDYERMCFGDYSYPQTRNCRTSVANWYARAAHTVVDSYNALLAMFKFRNKPPTCAGSSFLTSTHPNPQKRYTLFYADNRGWMMKPARRSNVRPFPGTRVVQAMRCEFKPKFWRKPSAKCPKSCVCPRREAMEGNTASSKKRQMKVRSSQNLCCNCPPHVAMKEKTVPTVKAQRQVRSSQKLCCECPMRGAKKRKTVTNQKGPPPLSKGRKMKMGPQQVTCECPLSCECLASGKMACECRARRTILCDCPARETASCFCAARSPAPTVAGGKSSCKCLASGTNTSKYPTGGTVSCKCPVGGPTSCKCPASGTITCKRPPGGTAGGPAGGTVSCDCPVGGTTSCKCPASGTITCKCPTGGTKGGITGGTVSCKCPAGGTTSCKCPARGTITCKCPTGGTKGAITGGTVSCKCPVGGTTSCKCPASETITCKCPRGGTTGGTVSCKCPVGGTTSCKCPASMTITCKCPKGVTTVGTVSCKCPIGGTTSCKCPASGTITCKCPAGGTVSCKCPPGEVSCECPVHRGKGETVSCDCPVHGAKKVQKNTVKSSAAGDAYPKVLSDCICKEITKKESIQCMCSKSSTKPVPQRKQVNILSNYFYSTSGFAFNPTIYQTAQTKPNNLNSINISDISQNDFAKYRLSQRKNGTLPFGVVVDCGTKHPLIMNKETYGTHSFGLAGKTLKMSTKYTPSCNKKYLQGQSSTKSSTKYESSIKSKKTLNIHRTRVTEIKNAVPPKYPPRFKTNRSRAHSTRCDIALNCPCGNKKHDTDKKMIMDSSRDRSHTRNKSVLARLSQVVSTKQAGTSTYKINFADKTQNVSKQTLSQNVRSDKNQRKALQKQSARKDCIGECCPCKNKLNVDTESVVPKQNESNKKAIDCRCSTETKSSTAAKELSSKQPVFKCACKDEPSTKKEKHRSEQRLPDKKPTDCGCIAKTQSNTVNSPIQTALNCPCKSEQSVGTDRNSLKQIASNKKAIDCSCTTETKSSTAAKVVPSKQLVSECACKDEPITKNEKPRPEQNLPDKVAIDCGCMCMTENQPSTALNCPCKSLLSVDIKSIPPKQIVSNKKAVDCSCSTENKSSTAAKELPSKQPISKCACKDELSTKKGKTLTEKRLADEKPIDCGCMAKTQSKQIIPSKEAVECSCNTKKKSSTAVKELLSKQPVSKCSCKDEPITKKEKIRPEQCLPDKKAIDCGCVTKNQPGIVINCPCKSKLSVGAKTVPPKQVVSKKKSVYCSCSMEKQPRNAKELTSKQLLSKCSCKDEPITKKENPHPEQGLPDKKAIECGCMTENKPSTGIGPAIQIALNCPCKSERSIGTETVRLKQIELNKKAVDCRCSTEKKPNTAAKELSSKQPKSKCACKDKLSTKKDKPDKNAIGCGCMTEKPPITGKRPAIQTALNCPCKIERSIGTETVRLKQNESNKKTVDCRCTTEKEPGTSKDEPIIKKEIPRLDQRLQDKKAIDCGCLTENQANTGKSSAIQIALNCPCKSERSIATETVCLKQNESNKKAVDCRCSPEKEPGTSKDEPIIKKEIPRPDQRLLDKKAIDCGCLTKNQANTGKSSAIQIALNCPCKSERSIATETVGLKQTVPNKKAVDCRCSTEKDSSPVAKEHIQSIVTDRETNTSGYELQASSLEELSLKVNISEDHSLKCKTDLYPFRDKYRPTAIASENKLSGESPKQLGQSDNRSAQDPIKKKFAALLRRSVLTQKISKYTQYGEGINYRQIGPNQFAQFKTPTRDCGYGTDNQSSTTMVAHPIEHQRHAIEVAEKQVQVSSQHATGSQFGVALNCLCGNDSEELSNQEAIRQPSSQTAGTYSELARKTQPQIATDNNVKLRSTPATQTDSIDKAPSQIVKPLSSQPVIKNKKQQQTQYPYVLPKQGSGQQPKDSQFGMALNCSCGNEAEGGSSQETGLRQPLHQSYRKNSNSVLKTQPQIATDNTNVNLKSPSTVATDQTGSSEQQPSELFKSLSSQISINNKQQQTQPSYVLPKQSSSQLYGKAPDCACENQPQTVVGNNAKPKMPSITNVNKTNSIDKTQKELLIPLSSKLTTVDSKKQQGHPPTHELPTKTSGQQAKDYPFEVSLNCPCGNDRVTTKTQEFRARKATKQSHRIVSECACKVKQQIEKKFPSQQSKFLKTKSHSTQKQSKASECACELKSPAVVTAEHKSTNTLGTGLKKKPPSPQPKTLKTPHKPVKPSNTECACEVKSKIGYDHKNTYTNTQNTDLGEKVQQTKSPQTQYRTPTKTSKLSDKTSDKRNVNADESSLVEYTPSKLVKFRQNQPPGLGIAIDCPCRSVTDKRKYYKCQIPSSQHIKSSKIRSADPPSPTTKKGIFPPNRHTQTQLPMFGVSSDCVCESHGPMDTDDKILRSRRVSVEHLSKAPIHPLSQKRRATQTQYQIPQELPDYQQSKDNRSHKCETSLELQKYVQADKKCTCKHKSSISWCKKKAIKCICQTKKEMYKEMEIKDKVYENDAHEPRAFNNAFNEAGVSISQRENYIGKRSSSFKKNQRSTLTKRLSECKTHSAHPASAFTESSLPSSLIPFTHTECKCPPEKLNVPQSTYRSWKHGVLESRSDKTRSKLFGFNKNQKPQISLPNESACPCSHEKLDKISSISEKPAKRVSRDNKSLKQSSKKLCNKMECSPPSSQLIPSKSSRHTSKFNKLVMKLRSKFCRSKENQNTEIKLPNEPVPSKPSICGCPVSSASSQLKVKQVGKPTRSFFQRSARSQKSKTSQTKTDSSYLSHIECGCTIETKSSLKFKASRGKSPRTRSRYSQSSKKSIVPMNSKTSRSMTYSECRCMHSQCCCTNKTVSSKNSKVSSEKKKRFIRKPVRVDQSSSKSSRSSFFPSCRDECLCRDKISSSSQSKLLPKLFKGYKKQQSKISPKPSTVISLTPIECVCLSGETSSTQSGEKYHTLKIPDQSTSTPQYVQCQHNKISQFPSHLDRSQESPSVFNNLQQKISDLQHHSGKRTALTQFPSPLCMSTISTKNSKPLSDSMSLRHSGPLPNSSPQQHSDLMLYRAVHKKSHGEISRSLNVQTAPIIPGKCACLSEKLRKQSEISQYSQTDSSHPITSIAKEKINTGEVPQGYRKTKIESDKLRLSTKPVDISFPIETEKLSEFPEHVSTPQSDLPRQDLSSKLSQSKHLTEKLDNGIESQKPPKTQMERNLKNPSQPYPYQHIQRPYSYDPSRPIIPIIPGMCTCALKQRLSEYLRKIAQANKPKQNIIQPEISDSSPGIHIVSKPPIDEQRIMSDTVSHHSHIAKTLVKQRPLSNTVSEHSQKSMLETDVQAESNQQFPSNKLHSLHNNPPGTEVSFEVSRTRATQQPEISKYSGNLGSPPVPSVEKQQGSVKELPRKPNIGTDGQPGLLQNLSSQPEKPNPFHDFHPARIIPGKCTCSVNIYKNSLELVANHMKRDLRETNLQSEPLHHLPYQSHVSYHPTQNIQQSHRISRLSNSDNKIPRLGKNDNHNSNIKGQAEKLIELSRHVIVQRSEIMQSSQNLQKNLPLKQILSVLKRNACECPTEESNISPEETSPVLLQRRSSGQQRKGEAAKQRNKPVKQQAYPDFNRVTMRYPARKRSEQSPGRKKTEHIPPPAKNNYPPAVGVSCPPNFSRRPCYANPANKCGPKSCFDESALRRAYKRRPLRYTPPKQQPKSKKQKKQKKDKKKDKQKEKQLKEKQKEKQKRKKAVPVKRKTISRTGFSGFNIFQCCQCVQDLVDEAEKDAWPNDVTCRPIYIHALKRKPCFWIFKLFPSLYPTFLSCFKLQKNVCQMCLYVLALCLWSPFLLCFYICFNLLCKI